MLATTIFPSTIWSGAGSGNLVWASDYYVSGRASHPLPQVDWKLISRRSVWVKADYTTNVRELETGRNRMFYNHILVY